MIGIPTNPITVERHNGGDWIEGEYVKDAPDELIIEASVQPLKPNEVKILPEHLRSSESLKIYTEAKLIIADEKNQIPGDIIVHDGKRFIIHSVSNWSIGTDIPHFKCVAVKIDGEGGGNVA